MEQLGAGRLSRNDGIVVLGVCQCPPQSRMSSYDRQGCPDANINGSFG
jgi:hypothetical protein